MRGDRRQSGDASPAISLTGEGRAISDLEEMGMSRVILGVTAKKRNGLAGLRLNSGVTAVAWGNPLGCDDWNHWGLTPAQG